MNIGLDYDGTFTSDPALWLHFIAICQSRRHTVYIVTMRYPSEMDGTHGAVDPRIKESFKDSVQVVCTGVGDDRLAKKAFCEARGINIHIWIDDNPQAVNMSASEIWKNSSREGAIVDPHYE